MLSHLPCTQPGLLEAGRLWGASCGGRLRHLGLHTAGGTLAAGGQSRQRTPEPTCLPQPCKDGDNKALGRAGLTPQIPAPWRAARGSQAPPPFLDSLLYPVKSVRGEGGRPVQQGTRGSKSGPLGPQLGWQPARGRAGCLPLSVRLSVCGVGSPGDPLPTLMLPPSLVSRPPLAARLSG